MKKLCTYTGCKAIVHDGYRCPAHPQNFTIAPTKKVYKHHFYQGKNIYFTNRWKKIRAIVLSEEPLCRMCGRFGIVTQAVAVDHIVEIKDGADPFDRSNMQSLCHSCHNKKTGEEVRRRSKEKKMNGFKSLSSY